jgi:hypothetical protein
VPKDESAEQKRFAARRIICGGDLWITEFILTYDGQPSYTVRIMEFRVTRLRGKHSTSPIHSWLPHGVLNGSNGWTHNLGAREFANDAHPRMEGQEMDWKRLVQFALLASSDLGQYAILLVRVSLGLFFAISGANKLFVAGSTQTMYATLVEVKVPFPHLITYFVSGVEFVGGSLLTLLGRSLTVPIFDGKLVLSTWQQIFHLECGGART